METITQLAARFRAAIKAIKACDPKRLTESLRCFPHGACGQASELLGAYLTSKGLGEFDYFGGCRDGKTHAWLQQGDLIVDITGDQFDDMDCKVFVSRDHTWHDTFSPEGPRERSDFTGELHQDYSAILKKLAEWDGRSAVPGDLQDPEYDSGQ